MLWRCAAAVMLWLLCSCFDIHLINHCWMCLMSMLIRDGIHIDQCRCRCRSLFSCCRYITYLQVIHRLLHYVWSWRLMVLVMHQSNFLKHYTYWWNYYILRSRQVDASFFGLDIWDPSATGHKSNKTYNWTNAFEIKTTINKYANSQAFVIENVFLFEKRFTFLQSFFFFLECWMKKTFIFCNTHRYMKIL